MGGVGKIRFLEILSFRIVIVISVLFFRFVFDGFLGFNKILNDLCYLMLLLWRIFIGNFINF